MEDIQHLIKECLANNRLGQEKLYKKFYPSLFLLCRKFYNNDVDAMEALNDGMLQVFTQLHKYDDTKGTLYNWAYTVVRNVVLDKLRLKKWPPLYEITEESKTVDAGVLKQLEWKDIYKLLDNLPPATRIVCSLFYLEDFSIKEISTNIKLSEGTVKWHLSEARNKMKPILEKHYQKK
ncbi:sigma-70 family RNA polymerase sigma factor [Chitinophaga silvatica]|uniref:Sigma-70 family RNA polymerase sigma factor n=1 Tax=Chitinophaga silvatica TaxID=2282649 RepID=A0A3E1YAL5_9BACT|nr:sigma-70 family RNA polymerase sigma factor [Chitinophaga silvatica]RFS22722.1 sigma-70 family RNA polymerase sigma factor [Chitinophaga silvatica]